MLNRPRPMLQLLAFLCGGFTMGITVGLVVLFVFRRRLLGSAYFTLPKVQILIGVLALAVAAVLAARAFTGTSIRRLDPRAGNLAALVRRLLNGRSLWVAGVAGLGIALPSVDYLAALAVILASGAAATTQVGALLMFNARGLRDGGDSAPRLSFGAPGNACVDGRAARLDPVASPRRGCHPADRGRLCPARRRPSRSVNGPRRKPGASRTISARNCSTATAACAARADPKMSKACCAHGNSA